VYAAKKNIMADNSIPAVNDANFEAEVLTASNAQPVMVDFWAEWCRPCHMLAPTVAEIAHDNAGKLKVVKLNVDEAVNSAGRYNIRGIPTLLVFKNGQVVEQIVGAVPKDQITKALQAHIS
jgi:thioredoxin 1